MHRRSRLSAVVALTIMSASVVSAAHASTTITTLYVDNATSACRDSGAGTQAVPFCTVQAAFGKVSAGQTVEIEAGTYTSPATLSTSGTAASPITVRFGIPGVPFNITTAPAFRLPARSTATALTISHASYVNIENVDAETDEDYANAVSVENSSHVVFTGGYINNASVDIGVSGASSDVTVERMSLTSDGTAVAITSGVTGTIVTTNEIDGDDNSAVGVAVTGASGTDIVGNSMWSECTAGVAVSGGAASTTVENNIITTNIDSSYCSTTLATAVGLKVASDSVAGTTEKYDTVSMYESPAVEWAGVSYTTTTAFQAASGQGTADILLGDNTHGITTHDTVDDADALAPGELSTDRLGRPRVDDPQIPNTGTGVGYYDRGAYELQDPMAGNLWGVTSSLGLGAVARYEVSGCGLWSGSFTGSINWGDGQSTAITAADCTGYDLADDHTYATPGTYTVTLSATDGIGKVSATDTFTTAGEDYTSYGPSRILDTRKGVGVPQAKVAAGSYAKVKVAGNGTIPSDVTAVALNLTVTDVSSGGFVAAGADGAGKPATSNLNFGANQTVANSAIVQVGSDGYIDVYNGSAASSADLIADVTGYFTPTAASGYTAVPLDRILDTRKAIGAPAAKVASNAELPITIAGVDSIPAAATAVAVHVTVTDAAGGGWIAAVPDGLGVPTTSSLNFGKGQTVSNTVIVPVAADGKIDLYNGSGGSADLIADVSGYFSASSTGVYVPVSPFRALDTRIDSSGPLKADTAYGYPIEQTGIPATAIVANLTVTQPTAGGDLIAYPPNSTRPTTSNVNFVQGQTVANLALLDNDPTQTPSTEAYNESPGTTHLVIDVFGYFSAS